MHVALVLHRMLGAEQEGCEAEAGKFALVIAAVKLFVAVLEMTAVPQLFCFQLLSMLAHP